MKTQLYTELFPKKKGIPIQTFSPIHIIFQKQRTNIYTEFKEGKKRILVATDLFGRGIDIERVNLVINFDMPEK